MTAGPREPTEGAERRHLRQPRRGEGGLPAGLGRAWGWAAASALGGSGRESLVAIASVDAPGCVKTLCFIMNRMIPAI